jgi:hypothetical protein
LSGILVHCVVSAVIVVAGAGNTTPHLAFEGVMAIGGPLGKTAQVPGSPVELAGMAVAGSASAGG